MGQSQIFVSVSEADSTTVPDCKCCITGPLDNLCDYDRLWLELTAGLRTDFAKDPNLKCGEIEDISESEFKVKKVYDGVKLRLPEGKDIITQVHYVLDKAKGKIYEEYRDPVLKYLTDIRITRTLRDPLRMEAWHQRVKVEERRAGPLVAIPMANILQSLLDRDVAVTPRMPSRLMPDRGYSSAMSEPLDGDITLGALWDGIMRRLRSQSMNQFAREVEVLDLHKEGPLETFDVVYVNDGQKLLEANLASSADDRPVRAHVRADGDKHAISMVLSDPATHQIFEVTCMHIHSGPLQVETWSYWATPPAPDAVQESLLSGYVAVLLHRVCN